MHTSLPCGREFSLSWTSQLIVWTPQFVWTPRLKYALVQRSHQKSVYGNAHIAQGQRQRTFSIRCRSCMCRTRTLSTLLQSSLYCWHCAAFIYPPPCHSGSRPAVIDSVPFRESGLNVDEANVLSRLHHISLPQSVDCLYKRLLTLSVVRIEQWVRRVCVCLFLCVRVHTITLN